MNLIRAVAVLAAVSCAMPLAAQDSSGVRELPPVELREFELPAFESLRSSPAPPTPAVARVDLLDVINDLDDGEAIEFWEILIGDPEALVSLFTVESAPGLRLATSAACADK